MPDYGVVSLAVSCLFDAFLIASRAFSICICLAIMSSALSISRSSSTGSTDIVTDFVSVGFVPTVCYCPVALTAVWLLDEGISVVCAVSFFCVVSNVWLDKSIILLSTVVS